MVGFLEWAGTPPASWGDRCVAGGGRVRTVDRTGRRWRVSYRQTAAEWEGCLPTKALGRLNSEALGRARPGYVGWCLAVSRRRSGRGPVGQT